MNLKRKNKNMTAVWIWHRLDQGKCQYISMYRTPPVTNCLGKLFCNWFYSKIFVFLISFLLSLLFVLSYHVKQKAIMQVLETCELETEVLSSNLLTKGANFKYTAAKFHFYRWFNQIYAIDTRIFIGHTIFWYSKWKYACSNYE